MGTDYSALALAADHCVTSGEASIDHCLGLLSQGEKEMAAWKSAYVPRMSAVVMDMCKACEEECRKHEKKHKKCKAIAI